MKEWEEGRSEGGKEERRGGERGNKRIGRG